MLADSYPFWGLMGTMLVFFLWLMWVWLLFEVFADVFRRHDISGWGKTAWLIVVIILPFLGVFIYLISQNKGMRERGRVREATREATRGYYGSDSARRRSSPEGSCSTAARSRWTSSTQSSRRRWRSLCDARFTWLCRRIRHLSAWPLTWE